MEITVRDKKISVFGNESQNVPIVYLNTVHGEGPSVWKTCQGADCPQFILAAISGLRWDHDMSPWAIPPITSGDTPCTGGAEEYLELLTEDIVPTVESELDGTPTCRALAGYSLAGLFALYSAYQTNLFTRIACVSGSLWFPDFPEYVLSHEMKAPLTHLYLSLGEKEAKTRNPYLKTVEENTTRLYDHYKKMNMNTIFELNPGNHFHQPNERTAAGITWILK